jgi:hypothetical protein
VQLIDNISKDGVMAGHDHRNRAERPYMQEAIPVLKEKVMQMENGKIVTRVNTVWLGEDGIVRIIHVSGAEVALDDAEETMAAYLKINEGKRRPLFVDTKSMKSLARGRRRQYYSGEEAGKVASAVAIVVDTPVSKPHLPSQQLFTSEDESLAWLKGYIE